MSKKTIDEMTPDDLRRELAAYGYDIDPTDACAALFLCLNLAFIHAWTLVMESLSGQEWAAFYQRFDYWDKKLVVDAGADTGETIPKQTAAVALSRLALAALRTVEAPA